jgi:hypothetical protein
MAPKPLTDTDEQASDFFVRQLTPPPSSDKDKPSPSNAGGIYPEVWNHDRDEARLVADWVLVIDWAVERASRMGVHLGQDEPALTRDLVAQCEHVVKRHMCVGNTRLRCDWPHGLNEASAMAKLTNPDAVGLTTMFA